MPYPEEYKAEVVAAVRAYPWSVSAAAKAFGIDHSTVTRWARNAGLKLPSPGERMTRGGKDGTAILHGDHEKRRARARAMRAKGKTLEEIRVKCGYRSIASAHYAVAGHVPR
jgi:transposase-like protein